MFITYQTSSNDRLRIGAYIKVFACVGCFVSRLPLMACFFIDFARCALSADLVPIKITASPNSSTTALIMEGFQAYCTGVQKGVGGEGGKEGK